MITRNLQNMMFSDLQTGKAILLYGARRVGKTILLKNIIKQYNKKTLFFNGEDITTTETLTPLSIKHYQQLFQNTELLAIDEAQNIPNIGKIIKLIVDNVKDTAVIATGSSSFDLHNQTGEPLVGRSYQYKLYPFSVKEYTQNKTRGEFFQELEERLVYGMYPELFSINDYNKKQRYLLEVIDSYLLKDILTIDGIKNSNKMRDLLRLIAYQVGSEVSYEELARQLGLSRNSVEKYLDLLAKTFVIFKLPAFSKNKRKEVSKSCKWFFVDNGIRNAIINDFRPIALRQDVGALWESFLISERIKMQNNNNHYTSFYFWRSYTNQEIDLIEEANGSIKAFEFKWGDKKVKKPSIFGANYPDVEFKVIRKADLLSFVF